MSRFELAIYSLRLKDLCEIQPMESDSQSEPIRCYYKNYYSTSEGECTEFPTDEQIKEFHALLDNADEENSHEFDRDLKYQGDIETYVDEDFYVCPNHYHMIHCDECGNMLTRSQLRNFLNSSDYNHLNEGHCRGPAGCTSCWIRYDSQLQAELGVDSDGEYKNSDDEEEDEEEEEEEEGEEVKKAAIAPSLPPTQTKITLADLDAVEQGTKQIPQKRIQEENVKYGLARCKRESKAKSIKKLRNFLTANPNAKYVEEKQLPAFIWIANKDDLTRGSTLKCDLPPGKTREDLVLHIKAFFDGIKWVTP